MFELDDDEVDEILSNPDKYKFDEAGFPNPELFNQVMGEGTAEWDGFDDEFAPYLDFGTGEFDDEDEKCMA